jgi:tetratricopeptide (TPR) repeat protein
VLAGDPRRLILFASHGASIHWVDGLHARLLNSWSAGCVTLLHLLPRLRWARTMLGQPHGIVRAEQPGSTMSALKVEPRWYRFGPTPEEPSTIRLPAVPIEPAALKAWARMQMGLGRGSEAFLLDSTQILSDDEVADLAPDQINPDLALTNLQERSAAALDLARMLASAPFTIPVARLVQEVTQKGSTDFSVLAELMLSGLVVARTGEADITRETTYYMIREPIRLLLLRSLRNADAVALAKVLDQRISEHLSAIAGRTVQFSALIANSDGTAKLPIWAQPFAYLTTALQDRIAPSIPRLRSALESVSDAVLGQQAHLATADTPLSTDALKRLKQASVFIPSSDGSSGSGYLVAPNRVVTAWHVVRSWQKRKAQSVIIGVDPRRVCQAALVAADEAADAALLAIDAAVDNAPLPIATGLVRKVVWDGYGYPAVANKIDQPPGLAIDGHVQDPSTFTERGQKAVLLYSENIAAGRASPLRGFSGSPVTVDGAVIGHIIKHIIDTDDPARAAYGYVYACPIAAVVALLGNVPVTTQPIAPAPITTLSDVVPALPKDEYHVYVSYRSSDRAWAMSLVARLEGVGLRVFFDQKELEVGQSLAAQLQSALTRSRAAVVLVSKGWIESPWCQQESEVLLDRALKDPKFELVPLLLDDSPMPTLLNTRLWIDFKGTPRAEGDGFERLISTLLKRTTGPPDSVAAKAAVAERKLTDEFVARINSAAVGNAGSVKAVLMEWQRTASSDLTPVLAAAEVLIGKSEFNEALNVVKGAGSTLRAYQLRALALSKSGRNEEAVVELEALRREGNLDPETAGLLAGRYRAIWLNRRDETYKYLSYEIYLEAYERSGDPFNGINAASMALLCGDTTKRSQLAQQVVDKLKDKPKAQLGSWDRASLGEGYLLLEKFERAAEWYDAAAAAAAGLHQNIAVMRAQARRNLKAMGRDESLMDAHLPVPRVLAYMGHMVDAPGRTSSRLPPEKIGRLRNEINRRFDGWGAVHGFGTAARGTDILVLEALAQRGLTATVVLPFPRADFETISVGGTWNKRLEALETTAGLQFIPPLLDSMPAPNQLAEAFENANREVFARANAYARSLDERPVLLAVWDGQPGDGPGGTADAVQLWREEGYEPEIINPRNL